MTNPPKNSGQNDKIVNAAAQLFARQGYHGTSTREIARLADISENTLFRYFEHKEDLFWAAFARVSAVSNCAVICSPASLKAPVLKSCCRSSSRSWLIPRSSSQSCCV